MIGFYDLKKALFFPQMAGFLRAKKDVPYLYDLLVKERIQTRLNMKEAIVEMHLIKRSDIADRLERDWVMLDQTYEHDIALCSQFMLENGIMPI